MSGTIPTAKLGDSVVASIILGQSPPSSAYNAVGDGLPFFQGKADFGLVHPIPRVWCNAGQKFAAAGDILISVRAPVGDVNIATGDCVIGRGITAIRAEGATDPWFLYFALIYCKPDLESRATGSTFASVNKATLDDLDIPFPEPTEQVGIGLILRKLLEGIEHEVAIISTAQELKRAAMRELFTRGLRSEPQKETEIGPMPESWEISECEELAAEITVGVVVKPASYYVANGVPAFRSLNIREDRIDASSLVYFSARDNDTILSKSKLKAGDVLVVRTGYPGTSCVVPDEFDGANCIDLVILKPKRDIVKSEFVSRFLNSESGKSQALSNSYGLAQQHLNVGAVRRLKLPLPLTLEEQAEIVGMLDAIDRKIELHRQKHAVLNELFKALLHKLMTGEVRVADLDLSALNASASVMPGLDPVIYMDGRVEPGHDDKGTALPSAEAAQ